MDPYRLDAHAACMMDVLALIRDAFGYMDGRIDPPSSMHRLSDRSLSRAASEGELWAIGTPPLACVVLSEKPGALYVGKLAVVAASARGQGLARALIDLAEARARLRGLPVLELQTRVELNENHATFARLGFTEVGRTAHEGYARPTSITMRKTVAAPGQV
ncbi:unnamed protein product [Ectocarpus sp. 12 AP-2014]